MYIVHANLADEATNVDSPDCPRIIVGELAITHHIHENNIDVCV